MRRRFFVERFANGKAVLEGDAAHHLGRVLRAEPGQVYELSDGNEVFLARVENSGRERVEFALLEPVAVRESRLRVDLLLAIVKFDRFEWALEKAVELGVDSVVPLAAARSEKGLIVAAAKRAVRWRTILMESAQQARRLRPPLLGEVERAADAFKIKSDSRRVMLSERPGAATLRTVFDAIATKGAAGEPVRVTLAVGPEGGWTDDEFAAAAAAGFAEAALGENILRTETAVVAGIAAARLFFD